MNNLITELIQVCLESSYMPSDASNMDGNNIETFDFSCLKKDIEDGATDYECQV